MASPMKQSETIRARKLNRRGKWAKNRRANAGSTKPTAELFAIKG